jgi:superfamily II DNA or RNA helicase
MGPVVSRVRINELTGGYLADFDQIVIHVPLLPEERAIYDREMRLFRSVYKLFRRTASDRWQDFVAAAMHFPQSEDGRQGDNHAGRR